jgi:hypothetical protein
MPSIGKEGAMLLNFLSDEDNERSLFNAAGNGDVRAQEELEHRYRIFIWCKNDPKAPSPSGRKAA